MTTGKKSNPTELKTEGPLKEKDEQNRAIEQQRKLGEIALAKWRRFKQKIENKLKR